MHTGYIRYGGGTGEITENRRKKTVLKKSVLNEEKVELLLADFTQGGKPCGIQLNYDGDGGRRKAPQQGPLISKDASCLYRRENAPWWEARGLPST